MTDLFDTIARYLNNEMTSDERAIFEEQLQKDKALNEEVEVYRGLQGFLNREAPALENKLTQLGEEFSTKKKRIFSFRRIGMIVSIILVLGIIYFSNFSNFSKKEEPVNSNPSTSTIKENTNPATTEQEESIKGKAPQKNEEETKSTPNITQPIALNEEDFKPNPTLENLMARTVRNSTSKEIITVTKPVPDAVFSSQPLISLVVNGTTNSSAIHQLIVFSNRQFDIENDYPLLEANLSSSKNRDGYNIRFNGELPLQKGLYYLMIRRAEDLKLLYISKFTVQ